MKRLYIVRHAKSSWKDVSLQDFDRPLNSRGKHDAPVMGQRLASQQVQPDLIVSSPAKRALKTAKIIAGEIGYPKKQIRTEASIYEASTATLLKIVQNLNDTAAQAMLFGHNPGLTSLAEHLTGAILDNIPTCGIVCVDFDVNSWQQVKPRTGTLVLFDYPKKAA